MDIDSVSKVVSRSAVIVQVIREGTVGINDKAREVIARAVQNKSRLQAEDHWQELTGEQVTQSSLRRGKQMPWTGQINQVQVQIHLSNQWQ